MPGLLVAVVSAGFLPLTATAAPPTFVDSAIQSSNGVVQLEWSASEGPYEVELAQDGVRRTVYRGSVPSAHVSGLRDGEYHARVRARRDDRSWSNWSGPALIRVEHHAMPLVWTLLGTGAVTFIATGFAVAWAVRRHRV
ncbi:MAG: hypothetical protein B7733_07490 [Myxococcales bacterium FL481]|nr:MAG: hypothetical protein B7733_07490 [Myxococcales bacterium FL481]